jgi:hypothetical protein
MAEISYFAAALGISLEAAARLLGIPTAAEGGRFMQNQPVLVGERGPELFVPNVPGTVVPQYAEPRPMTDAEYMRNPDWLRPPTDPAAILDAQRGTDTLVGPLVRPEAWDRWLANTPESENIEDQRSDDQRDMDQLRWRRAHAPKKPLVQFPPAPAAKSTVPDWLKDQESQWLTRNRK